MNNGTNEGLEEKRLAYTFLEDLLAGEELRILRGLNVCSLPLREFEISDLSGLTTFLSVYNKSFFAYLGRMNNSKEMISATGKNVPDFVVNFIQPLLTEIYFHIRR